MTSRIDSTESRPFDGVTAELVVAHVRALIDQGQLKPGDRLPAERELAVQIGVSRPSVRAGLRALAAMGVVFSRHGAGTFIRSGPPMLGSEPLSFLAALHGFTRDEMFEARRVLEVGVAGLAAEHATGEHLAAIAEEITGMFASLADPLAFLRHDIRFHRAVAAASGNPILASLVEMVSALFYEQRRKTAGRAQDLRESAEMHRTIYNALRLHDPQRARDMMNDHLVLAQQRQKLEPQGEDEAGSGGAGSGEGAGGREAVGAAAAAAARSERRQAVEPRSAAPVRTSARARRPSGARARS